MAATLLPSPKPPPSLNPNFNRRRSPLIVNPSSSLPAQQQQAVASNSSTADSAIGTGTSPASSPFFQSPSSLSRSEMRSNIFSPSQSASASTNAQTSRPGTFVDGRQKAAAGTPVRQQVGLPIRRRIICERDFEHIVKETEILVGGEGTSREELISESRLSRECLLQRKGSAEDGEGVGGGETSDGVQESRRYYLFDPVRHEYRLYYTREVRLMCSESNLPSAGGNGTTKSATNLRDTAEDIGTPSSEEMRPLRRRHSAGSMGRLRRAVPPPLLGNGHLETPPDEQHPIVATINGTSSSWTAGRSGMAQGSAERQPGGGEQKQIGRECTNEQQGKHQQPQQQQPMPLRRGAFERNSASRKPEPARRRQWSGGVKRATALKLQQELLEQGQQPRRFGGTAGAGSGSSAEQSPAVERRMPPRWQPTTTTATITLPSPDDGTMTKKMATTASVPLPLPTTRQRPSTLQPAAGAPVVTNQMLKRLLRPLHEVSGTRKEPSYPRPIILPLDSAEVPLLDRPKDEGGRWPSSATRLPLGIHEEGGGRRPDLSNLPPIEQMPWTGTRPMVVVGVGTGGTALGTTKRSVEGEQAEGQPEGKAQMKRKGGILRWLLPWRKAKTVSANDGLGKSTKRAEKGKAKSRGGGMARLRRWLGLLLGLLLLLAAAAAIAILVIIYYI